MTKEKTYVIRIFDGVNTTIYTIKDTDIYKAENKIRGYHFALGGDIVKITTTEQRG